jgi:two-component system response regulator YesN
MYRLLIVDDEPFTVDGLYEMLSNTTGFDLDIYKAYSAEEAIHRLSRTKMDIVLSDIRMPEVDGLQLQSWIRAQWPRCKVIFLTGINDIQYAQQAQRSGSIDYILKTEGDEVILASIRKAIDAIQDELLNEDVLIRAKSKLKEVQLMLRKEWFMTMLEQGDPNEENLPARLRDLDTSLDAREKILLVCGRVDRWNEKYNMSDQTLLLYAIQNIAEEFMEKVIMLPVMLDNSYFVWLIQPKYADELEWNETSLYVQGTLESIQQTCKSLLNLPISVISQREPLVWQDISRTFIKLKQQLILGIGNGEEMNLVYNEEEAEPAVELSGLTLQRIESAVEMGKEQLYRDLIAELYQRLPNRFSIYVQVYYAIAVILLNKWNKLHRFSQANDGYDESVVDKLLNVNGHKSKELAFQYLSESGAAIIQLGKNVQDDRTERIIQKLNRYIAEHLDKDLSLAVLAEAVYLNPSYLSNMYKIHTGRNISEYITEMRLEKAKFLLAETQAKVQEIGSAIGFETAGYFTRFFKKHVGVTPQEFRSRLTD